MEAMVATTLFIALPGGRSWLFDPFGAAPDEDGRVDKGVLHHVAVPYILSHRLHMHDSILPRSMCVDLVVHIRRFRRVEALDS